MDIDSLEFICEDDGGKLRWYYDPAGKEYLCLKVGSNTYTYRIPADKFFTLDEYKFQKMSRFMADGLQKFIPPEELEKMCSPQSQAVLKLCAHKAVLEVENGDDN